MIMDRVDGLPTQHVETRPYDTIKVIDIDGIESPDDKVIGYDSHCPPLDDLHKCQSMANINSLCIMLFITIP